MLRGALLFGLFFLLTIPVFLLLLLFSLPILLLPAPARVALRGPQILCGRLWIFMVTRILERLGHPGPQVEQPLTLEPNGRYLILCNHVSWSDILVLLQLFGARMPFPRFLAKRQMLWIPLIGAAIWVLDFPLLRRSKAGDPPERAAADRAAVARTCRRLGSGAFSLVIFSEGTRFTAEKHRRQESPFRHLLRPRAGGLGIALEHLGTRLDGVVDVTIGYSDPQMTYLDYLGATRSTARARVELLAPPELPGRGDADRQVLQEWLNARWQVKDALLARWAGESETLSAGHDARGPV